MMEHTNQSQWACRLSLLCAAAMIALNGGIVLVQDLAEETRELPFYALTAAGSLLAGLVLVSGLKNYKAGKQNRGMLQAAAAILLLAAGRSWNLWGTAPEVMVQWLILYIKYALAIFWPLMLLKAAKTWGYGRYLLFVCFGIWILEDVMVPQSWKDADWLLTETAVFLCFAYLVFFKEYIVKRKERGGWAAAGGAIAVSLAGAVILIYKSSRLRVILYSLGVHLFDKAGSIRDVKWLDYRMEAARANWSGTLETGFNRIGQPLMNGEVWLTWKRFPLSCLNAEYGKPMLLLFLILFVGMLFFAGRISLRSRQSQELAWYIRAELIAVAVFSMANELFLVQTGVGLGNYFPLLGNGVQMLPLLCILYHLNRLEAVEKAGKDSCDG